MAIPSPMIPRPMNPICGGMIVTRSRVGRGRKRIQKRVSAESYHMGAIQNRPNCGGEHEIWPKTTNLYGTE